MRPKILIAAGLALAFLVGAAANGIYTGTTRAFNPEEEKAVVQQRTVARPAVATRTQYVQPRTVYVSNPSVAAASAPVNAEKKRSLKKEVLIVGGSAGAGAAVGAVAGGKKGAAIGALSGGIAGLVYDLATRNK